MRQLKDLTNEELIIHLLAEVLKNQYGDKTHTLEFRHLMEACDQRVWIKNES